MVNDYANQCVQDLAAPNQTPGWLTGLGQSGSLGETVRQQLHGLQGLIPTPIPMPEISGAKHVTYDGTNLKEHDTHEKAVEHASDLVSAKNGPAKVIVFKPSVIVRPKQEVTVTQVEGLK